MPQRFTKKSLVPAPRAEVFAWHERPGAFERLAPPWQDVRLVRAEGGLKDGARVEFDLVMGPKKIRWVAEHYDYVEGEQFCDRQLEGPLAFWEHEHRFSDTTDGQTEIHDQIEFAVPFESIVRPFAGESIKKRIRAVFGYRARTLAADIELHRQLNLEPKRILIAGSSGLVGNALIPLLTTGGHEVVRLVRRPVKEGEAAIEWDPIAGFGPAELQHLEGFDAVINLAGESILGLFTENRKTRIRASRIDSTNNLAIALASLQRKPEVFISASAIGYYGNRGEEMLTEASELGTGFLADVCKDWEAAADPARQAGIRVVHPRIGVVLSPRGGALGVMKTPFTLGLGGPLGDGSHYMSWVGIDDLISMLLFAIAKPELVGPFNAVSPHPVTNAEFTRSLGRSLNRPAILPAPEFAVRGLLRETADQVLLSSARVHPEKLLAAGFRFRHRDLDEVFRHSLGQAEE